MRKKTTEKRRRHSRYIVAALKACRAICEGRTKQELHPALRLEAAKLIVAIENGVALPTVNDRLLRKVITEEIASGEINQTLLRMTGLLDRVERNQKKVIAPLVEQASEQIASHAEPVPESSEAQAANVLPEVRQDSTNISDAVAEALQTLDGNCGSKAVSTLQPKPEPKTPTPRTPQVRLSEDEIRAIIDFSELKLSAQELESALQPFLTIEWGGMDRDRITSVSLTGAKIGPEDRIAITPALVERAQILATSVSPRDRQLVKEWTQVVSKAPLFTAGADVVKEIMWLKQQVGL